MLLTWYGHAAFEIETQGVRVLTDPYSSQTAKPLPLSQQTGILPSVICHPLSGLWPFHPSLLIFDDKRIIPDAQHAVAVGIEIEKFAHRATVVEAQRERVAV